MTEPIILEASMDTSPVSDQLAAAIERAEAVAWEDLYAAAPADWAHRVDQGSEWVDGTLVLRWAAPGRRYFNRAIGLGVVAPAAEAVIDRILGRWEAAGIDMFLLQSMPHCRPEAYETWLRDRGLEPFDHQDRIVRDDRPLDTVPVSGRVIEVEEVTAETADEWARFVQAVYSLDTGPWLQGLVGRPRWRQYIARKGGDIVAARSIFAGTDGTAWLGIDSPVPGLRTGDYEPDARICRRIVADGLAAGVQRFIADIEVPSDAMDTPAYVNFAALGFTRPYVRTHWTVR